MDLTVDREIPIRGGPGRLLVRLNGTVSSQEMTKTRLVDHVLNHARTKNLGVDLDLNHVGTNNLEVDHVFNHVWTNNLVVDHDLNHVGTNNLVVDHDLNHVGTSNLGVDHVLNHVWTNNLLLGRVLNHVVTNHVQGLSHVGASPVPDLNHEEMGLDQWGLSITPAVGLRRADLRTEMTDQGHVEGSSLEGALGQNSNRLAEIIPDRVAGSTTHEVVGDRDLRTTLDFNPEAANRGLDLNPADLIASVDG